MSSAGELAGFVHRFEPGARENVNLLLLHGTGADENDLIPLGRELAPGAALLSPRGKVLEGGMPRFFRRLAEGVFDEEDLKFRTGELAEFVSEASARYDLDQNRLFAVGFSNGANIAASLLLSHPRALGGALLFRPMAPFEPDELPELSGPPIYVGAGRSDPIVPVHETERLYELLQEAGAEVSLHWKRGGHALEIEEIKEAGKWISRVLSGPGATA